MVEDLNWDYLEQIQLAVRVGLDLGASELQVQRSNGSATLPPVNAQSTCSYQITNILLPSLNKTCQYLDLKKA